MIELVLGPCDLKELMIAFPYIMFFDARKVFEEECPLHRNDELHDRNVLHCGWTTSDNFTKDPQRIRSRVYSPKEILWSFEG